MIWPAWGNRLNPYTALLADALVATGVEVEDFPGLGSRQVLRLLKPGDIDILHLHWPESMASGGSALTAWARALALLLLLRLARLTGTRIVWTVHNLEPHESERPRLEALVWRCFVSMVAGYICLTTGGAEVARTRNPRLRTRPHAVIPHGHYRDAYPNTVTKQEARARLAINGEARVVCYLGLIREYKNVPSLIEAFRGVAGPDHVLLVGGAPATPELAHAVRAAAGDDPRVRLRLEYLPDREVQVYQGAADLMVFPYLEVLNSGSALLALSFDRPLLVPNKGAMAELRIQFGDLWVRTYEGALTPGELSEALDWATAERVRGPDLRENEWPALGAATAAFYGRLIDET